MADHTGSGAWSVATLSGLPQVALERVAVTSFGLSLEPRAWQWPLVDRILLAQGSLVDCRCCGQPLIESTLGWYVDAGRDEHGRVVGWFCPATVTGTYSTRHAPATDATT